MQNSYIIPGHGRVFVGSIIWVTRSGYGKVQAEVTASGCLRYL